MERRFSLTTNHTPYKRGFDGSISLTANTIFKASKQKPLKALYCSSSSSNTSMEGSSEHISFADQSASIIMLAVKHGQNMILDLDPLRYNEFLRPIIEYLKFSPLSQALTMVESVHLSKTYLSAIYNKADDIIHFEVASHKT
ncbi:unnamed protein product [Lactuca saligna]|uniref:Uncharacterized protein n=1 Tax=Lactuca saligna TaxID=75948 RepID=A0AA36E9E7_LACSI|nr:unnamed protein product [Lactuca saligna]